jgi:hypothetical protein
MQDKQVIIVASSPKARFIINGIDNTTTILDIKQRITEDLPI